MRIGGKDYPIIGYVKSKRFGVTPMVDVPMMSDYKWQLKCLQSRLEHPEWYAERENVEEAVARLRKWLEEHDLEGVAIA